MKLATEEKRKEKNSKTLPNDRKEKKCTEKEKAEGNNRIEKNKKGAKKK